MKVIGITTTVPVEVLLAAGYKVIDLNNLFINSDHYASYIDLAERDGFPKSLCAWIKGIYGACIQNGIKDVIGVVEGDCSNTKALIEVLESKGVNVIPFGFPHSHEPKDIKESIEKLMEIFGVSPEAVEQIRKRLNYVRKLAKEIDEQTYVDGKATGFENHLYQIMLSDLNGNLKELEDMMEQRLEDIKKREPCKRKIRLGYIGVPPMTCDIYEYVEGFNAGFVYNEVQREFAFPRADKAKDIYQQYHDYTYPYDINFRLQEIKEQIKERKIDAMVHYTQAFCYKAIEDIIIKKELAVPVLTIEGDKLNQLDSRTKLRLEAFLDMMSDLKEV
jgi:benzoyl-CoA reductase/2-hydroxyglutaryl-CoA dehydratase subunit BcrC/BadD/HgdB